MMVPRCLWNENVLYFYQQIFYKPINPIPQTTMKLRLQSIPLLRGVAFIALAFIAFAAVAQGGNFTVSGVVTGDDEEPLIGVSVVANGSKNGVTTDIDGKYTISLPKASTLTFSYVGFEPKSIKVAGTQTLDVVMKPSAESLNDVVVVGYGTQRKANLTGAVQNVTSKELVLRAVGPGTHALQGMVPGLSASVTSGGPGDDGAIMKIRGNGSLNSSTTPLVLIDGVQGDLNRIDVNSIESITVLKDAASASIYGARAANGVILVTTKRGEEGRPKVSFNGYVGWNKLTAIPKAVDTYVYLEKLNEANHNLLDADPFNNPNPANDLYTQDIIDLYKNHQVDNMTLHDTDWRGLCIKDHSLTQNYSVSVSGGSKNLSVYADGYYYHQDGMIRNNSFERMGIRLNSDLRVNDYFSVGVDMEVGQAVGNTPGTSMTNIIGMAITLNSLLRAVNASGTLSDGVNMQNPYAWLDSGKIKNIMPTYSVRPHFRLTPIKGLTIDGSYTWKRSDVSSSALGIPYEIWAGDTFLQMSGQYATRSESRSTTVRKQYNLMGTYEKTFAEKHYLKVMAGFQSEELNSNSLSAGRHTFKYEGYYDIVNGDETTATNGSSRWAWSMLSWMGRINYAFNDRYLVEFNARYDGTSRFADGHRWGFFPSGSIGWRMSQEDFWENMRSWWDNMKIRASYGLLGNESISGYYPYSADIVTMSNPLGLGWWAPTYYPFDRVNNADNSALTQTAIANYNIGWEKSHQLNIGIDFGFFNNRLNGSFDYYVRHITDMLQRFTIPTFVQMSAPWQNAGTMRNNGWELSLNWADRVGDVNYFVRGNLSDVKTTITDLKGHGDYDNGTSITREGGGLNDYYGFICEGFYNSQEEIDATYTTEDGTVQKVWPVYNAAGNEGKVKPGWLKYRDVNKDGKLDSKDRVVLGSNQPRYEFALTLGAEWKGFDLQVMFQGVGKRDIYYSGIGAVPLQGYGMLYEHQLDTWTPDNTDAKYPLLLADTSYGASTLANGQFSDFWLKPAAYCRLKNLVVGYTIPQNITRKAFIEKCRVYFTANNLFTIRNNFYKGFDPETAVSGNSYCYPINKTFLVGLNLEF